MVPKDVKATRFMSSFFHYCQKENKTKIALKIKKEFIFIYPSYAYLYINNSYIWLQAGREFLPRLFKVLLFHHNKAVRVWKGGGQLSFFQPPDSLRCRATLNLSKFKLNAIIYTPLVPPLLPKERGRRRKKKRIICAALAPLVALMTGGAMKLRDRGDVSDRPISNRRYWVSCWSEVGIGGCEIAKIRRGSLLILNVTS